ncbi:MAG: peptidase T [Pantoea sp.]|uniref:Peptidase T n=1 Tax=Pantoea phytobeneficialis TaxID=2052056 RepID=A0AAP9KNX1_9GAMM|nr:MULTISPECIES: peptidase T [Pantoea]ERK08694.1 Tripeptide aminopeptidase [Pantoea sp. AS-PWVM4]MDO6407998.1 peptidase T [Pantoea phytobeneficialis]QGR06370.1 peptidase T [Pantoea phytobeneficialis]
MDQLLERFLSYVAVETQSKPQARQVPSSEGQWTLARQLQEELLALGFVDVTLSDHCCVMGTLPANVDWPTPVIGFISHMDTSPDFTAKNVNPQIIENYRGGDIALGNGDEILSPVMFPILHKLIGHTLVTTDGKTLLGADDKAGVAEIMTAMARLAKGDIPHGAIRVAFTPDEEIGRGTSYFDIENFAADWAYTVDGSDLGEFEFENFNAASAVVKIVGNNVHPGTAKGVMVNALELAMRFHAEVPAQEKPQFTEGYEGFYHLHNIKGTVEHAEMQYIIRDFDADNYAKRKQLLEEIGRRVSKGLHGECSVKVEISDSYRNMREKVEPHPHIIELALQAMRDCGIEPNVKPIRGGTDGSALSWKGLPCPNLFTGGYNYHGKHEFASLNVMAQAVDVIVRLAALVAEKK